MYLRHQEKSNLEKCNNLKIMKKIYQTNLIKKILVKEQKETVDSEGKKITALVDTEKDENHLYFIRVPNREILENQELFVAEIMAECDKRGIARRIARQKTLLDNGDVLSKDERELYEKSRESLWEKQAEYQSLNDKKDKTAEENEKLTKLTDELFVILNDIQGFEQRLDGELFAYSAESICQNRLLTWLTLNLSYEIKDNKNILVFPGEDYKAKLIEYDRLNDSDDEFNKKLLERLSLVVSLFSLGKAQTQEDFDLAIKYYEKQNLIQAVETLKENLTENNLNKDIKEDKDFILDTPIDKLQEEISNLK